MFADQISAAIDGARGGRHLDEISRLIWRGLAEGQIGDEAAQGLAERIHTRRTLNSATRGAGPPQAATGRPVSIFPPRRPQRPLQRPQAIERRRRVAASGAMPPQLASRFTTAEIAVLSIVADEVRHRGRCDRCLDEIAARAGCSRSSAKNAIRVAARIGIIRVTLRPRRGQRNLPNVIEVIDPAWRTWLKRGPRRSGGRGQESASHEYMFDSYVENRRLNAKDVATNGTDVHDLVQRKQRRAIGMDDMDRRRQCGLQESNRKTKF